MLKVVSGRTEWLSVGMGPYGKALGKDPVERPQEKTLWRDPVEMEFVERQKLAKRSLRNGYMFSLRGGSGGVLRIVYSYQVPLRLFLRWTDANNQGVLDCRWNGDSHPLMRKPGSQLRAPT